LAAIGQAVKDGQTVQAYELRRQLLADYPGLDQNPELVKAVASITVRERGLVKVVEQPIAAATEDRKPAAEFRVVLASPPQRGAVRQRTADGVLPGPRGDLRLAGLDRAAEVAPEPSAQTPSPGPCR